MAGSFLTSVAREEFTAALTQGDWYATATGALTGMLQRLLDAPDSDVARADARTLLDVLRETHPEDEDEVAL